MLHARLDSLLLKPVITYCALNPIEQTCVHLDKDIQCFLQEMYVTISAYGSRSSQGITGFNYMAHIIDSITLFILRIYQLIREIDFMSLVWTQRSTPELAAYDPCIVITWLVFSGMHLSNHVCCIYSIKNPAGKCYISTDFIWRLLYRWYINENIRLQ